MRQGWILGEESLSNREGREALYAIGNGYFCARGFFEEQQTGLLALGGIYAAGVFGKADYEPWRGEARELVNLANFFSCKISLDGEEVNFDSDKIVEYKRFLDMETATLTRSYVYKTKSGKRARLSFQRFASFANIHLCGQTIEIVPLDEKVNVELILGIRADVKNLNLVSSEPLPIQPGRKHIFPVDFGEFDIAVSVDSDKTKIIRHAQLIESDEEAGCGVQVSDQTMIGTHFRWIGNSNQAMSFKKIIYTSTPYNTDDKNNECQAFLCEKPKYDSIYTSHKQKLLDMWSTSDIKIDGSVTDQQVVRYNILQLMQSCPWHDSSLSIGARGLTGEMYEGCIFWDTEIFMLPFFTLTQPEEASRLLEFRYHTLEEAKEHAKANWFEGAMYPWQTSEKGIEQTPPGVGAYYSIHIIADIAYGILNYWRASGDMVFFENMGFEILAETAKFWLSRTTWDEEFERYNILAVRGPNEYDVIVNNNFYTNYMGKENLEMVSALLQRYEKEKPELYQRIVAKSGLDNASILKMQEVAAKIYLCYDKQQDLYLEDDMYHKRVPVNMKKAKPTSKRIIDTAIPYEALMLYQISKQADVLHLMNLFPRRFSEKQKRIAWNYYEPKTAHDSSLSYSQHSIMASTLGKKEIAYKYFQKSARLDIDDVQLNTISGLHFANFGGTWQAVVNGFCGICVDEKGILIYPNLPDLWNSVSLVVYFMGTPVNLLIQNDYVEISAKTDFGIPLILWDEKFELTPESGNMTKKKN